MKKQIIITLTAIILLALSSTAYAGDGHWPFKGEVSHYGKGISFAKYATAESINSTAATQTYDATKKHVQDMSGSLKNAVEKAIAKTKDYSKAKNQVIDESEKIKEIVQETLEKVK